ncbi:esterase-like [Apium graveolens]|uniref:esterase-like n=1 Tax=Apium graveolens TaxID=4045 RepID=UPI003D78D494
MNNLSFSLLSIFLFFFTVLSPVDAQKACRFPAIFNFGDGNSDTGGFTTTFGSTPLFYGQTFFKGPSGRSCDGRLVIDFMATSLGKKFLSSYLDSVGADFSQGANFAQILSPIDVPKLVLPKDTPPFGFNPIYYGVQFAEFVQFANRSQKIRSQGGKFRSLMPKEDSFAKGLYTFDIGQNDLTQALFMNTSIDDIKKMLPDLLNDFTAPIKVLYSSFGARTFWIHNTGPLGCLPYVLTILPPKEVDSVGCSKSVNDLAQYFNSLLKAAVIQLRSELPEAAITYVDINSAMYSLYLEPQKYGFELPLEACCGLGGEHNFGALQCGSTATINGSQVTATPCKDPLKRINWDGFAYSEAANKIVFEKIATGNYSDPPNLPQLACRRK